MLFARRILFAICLLGATMPLTNRIVSSAAIAQSIAQSAVPPSALPVCPPPASQEYLLLVRGETEADRARISTVLPVESTVLVCRYTDEIVVRAGGFTSLETANAWSTYMASVEGFESFVAQPAPANQPAQPIAGNSTTGSAVAYQPQQLSAGYAVLVEYGNRPEVATTIGQLVRPVGLAVYQQRAYLLAGFTADPAAASAILQRMSDAQLAAVIVPAEQVVRLTSEVSR